MVYLKSCTINYIFWYTNLVNLLRDRDQRWIVREVRLEDALNTFLDIDLARLQIQVVLLYIVELHLFYSLVLGCHYVLH